MLFNLILVMFLVLANGFFVAAEFAMVKVRNTRLESLILEGNRKAKFAQLLTKNLDAYLSACQLGITLSSLGLGWVGEPAIAKMIEPFLRDLGFSNNLIHTTAFAIAFSIITFLHIVLGELAPKSLAIQKSEGVTMWTAMPLIAFHKMMYPFIWFLNGTANRLLRLVGIQPAGEHEAAHTEEEIRILMEESHKSGYIDKTELALMDNIFDFAERNSREIMIPRTDMICLYAQSTFEENLEIALREQMTRYPVCNPDKDNIIGFIHIKDLFAALSKGDRDLNKLIRPVISTPESTPISSLLKIMQKKGAQLAIVIDEYGGTAGLLTIEDIIEEIVGEIRDEFDEERPSIEPKENDTFSVDGRLLLEEVNDYFGFRIECENIDTLGGWVYAQVETPPKLNQRVEFEGFEFIIAEVDNLRITRVLIKKPKPIEAIPPISVQSSLSV
ncbi:hemolysin family protein [Ammoniphilus sp. YIM 78166]|uniref:hemolysin family protein n=1 Tax=Ammoniphilus sp. YIM 78166 TaxID=1644106 RepID=UPI0010700FA4|nr:hemolysin family protein [Ammoniphilus sp. YIM 78166]